MLFCFERETFSVQGVRRSLKESQLTFYNNIELSYDMGHQHDVIVNPINSTSATVNNIHIKATFRPLTLCGQFHLTMKIK